jgi:ABC-type branched-subunit amino acid transport system ATPase component
VRPDAGRITYRGRDLLALPPQARAPLGIGRTFQQVGLSPTATVRDNLLLAQYAVEPYGVAAALTRTPTVGRVERRLAARADAALDLVGAADFAALRVGDLPHGSQRLVELAAVLASGAELILLDEPAAGMGPDEAARLAELLQRLRRSLRLTLLVIDHHVPFVSAACDRISVLDGGAVIADGSPERIRRDPLVAAVYLGEGDGNGEGMVAHA